MHFLVRLTFLSFCLYCNQNRSAHLCKLVSVNSPLAVNSVDFCSSHTQAAVHFRTAIEHLHLTNTRFILHLRFKSDLFSPSTMN